MMLTEPTLIQQSALICNSVSLNLYFLRKHSLALPVTYIDPFHRVPRIPYQFHCQLNVKSQHFKSCMQDIRNTKEVNYKRVSFKEVN